MSLLAVQPYVKVQKEIDSIKQRTIEHQRKLYLYNDKVVTKHRTFPIMEVTDISYRAVGIDGGLLYLHADRGLFSYTVKMPPEEFIEAFKKHKESTQV